MKKIKTLEELIAQEEAIKELSSGRGEEEGEEEE